MEKCKNTIQKKYILKYQLLPKINNLNYMMHQILYKIFKIILNIS